MHFLREMDSNAKTFLTSTCIHCIHLLPHSPLLHPKAGASDDNSLSTLGMSVIVLCPV